LLQTGDSLGTANRDKLPAFNFQCFCGIGSLNTFEL